MAFAVRMWCLFPPGTLPWRGDRFRMSTTHTPDPALMEPIRRDPPRGALLRGWLWHDLPWILMLLLALGGVTVTVPVGYWIVLTPVFGLICIVAGWRHVARQERLRLVITQALHWGALIVAITVLYRDGPQGVFSSTASSLTMLTLLALGTFTAGVQARVWRTCAVGAILFLAVPGIGWLDQSAVLLVVVTLVLIGMGGLIWWAEQR
jgi:hypothetical protein